MALNIAQLLAVVENLNAQLAGGKVETETAPKAPKAKVTRAPKAPKAAAKASFPVADPMPPLEFVKVTRALSAQASVPFCHSFIAWLGAAEASQLDPCMPAGTLLDSCKRLARKAMDPGYTRIEKRQYGASYVAGLPAANEIHDRIVDAMRQKLVVLEKDLALHCAASARKGELTFALEAAGAANAAQYLYDEIAAHDCAADALEREASQLRAEIESDNFAALVARYNAL